nr:hypothetical protein [Planctomycetota bacterium]
MARIARMTITAWATTTLERIFPRTRAKKPVGLALEAARGERISFQIAVRNPTLEHQVAALALAAPAGLATRIRRVGYVPIPHLNTNVPAAEIEGADDLPGWAPDPLFDGSEIALGGLETHAFWCNVQIPRDARPGVRRIVATVSVGDRVVARLRIAVTVHQLVIAPRRDFPVVQW